MTYGIQVRVSGANACFTRPEMKVERVSYDVITPSAARGILEAIYWKPAIRWVIDRLHVLKPIRFETIRRNEVGRKIPAGNVTRAMGAGSTEGLRLFVEDDRQQRAATVLCDVDYLIDAHFEFTLRAGPDDSEGKHLDMARRRAAKGQCFHQPCLGVREFPADFELANGEERAPDAALAGARDLGWMLLDVDYTAGKTPRFFKAIMRDGVIEVPPLASDEVRQ